MTQIGFMHFTGIDGESRAVEGTDSDSFDFVLDPVEQEIALLLPAVQAAREAATSDTDADGAIIHDDGSAGFDGRLLTAQDLEGDWPA